MGRSIRQDWLGLRRDAARARRFRHRGGVGRTLGVRPGAAALSLAVPAAVRHRRLLPATSCPTSPALHAGRARNFAWAHKERGRLRLLHLARGDPGVEHPAHRLPVSSHALSRYPAAEVDRIACAAARRHPDLCAGRLGGAGVLGEQQGHDLACRAREAAARNARAGRTSMSSTRRWAPSVAAGAARLPSRRGPAQRDPGDRARRLQRRHRPVQFGGEAGRSVAARPALQPILRRRLPVVSRPTRKSRTCSTQTELEADVLAFRRRLDEDDALFTRHARAIAGLYTETSTRS